MVFIQTILDLGASVMMPVIITLLGLMLRVPLKKSLRAGLSVGIGFIGIGLVAGLMWTNLGGLVEALSTKWNLALNTVDLGWPVAAGIAFSDGTLVAAMFAILIGVNVLMLFLNLTNTLNVDLWNFWHFILCASIVKIMTGSMILGCIAGAIYGGVVLFLADRPAKQLEKFLGYSGVTITTASFPVMYYLCSLIDKLIDKIPGLNKINFNLKNTNSKYSFFAEPMILGLILGTGLGFLSGYGWDKAIVTGVNMAGIMLILPRMVKILMEGLTPIANGAQEFMNARFPGRQVNIGMDFAIMLGDSEVITTALILTPVTLLIAMVLPGNRLLPFMDLPALPYFITAAVLAAKRNSFRAILISTIMIIAILLIATDMAPLVTEIGKASGLVEPGVQSASSMSMGIELIGWVVTKFFGIFS
ncbi:PTS galactitol transporter subunit IIC [Gottschalkiaceae bacterium SANA]|nr:PTS galactitol transporter subunit IIC [Gottschalkiaceae bacterium SANA]